MQISVNDTLPEALLKLADGNPGACHVLVELMGKAETVDPDNLLGQVGPLLQLDALELRGPDVWILYKNVCDSKVVNVLAVLRAVQLGLLSSTAVKECIAGWNEGKKVGLQIDLIMAQVRRVLPGFGR